MEHKAGGMDIWQALHVCPGSLEDVCCALLGSILVPSTRCFSQCWGVSKEQPAGGLRVRGDKSEDAMPGEMGWSQAHATQGCVGQRF